MADDEAYLEELKARRRATAGVRSTTFSDQSTTFDSDSLDKEIARVERALCPNRNIRYAATSKGI